MKSFNGGFFLVASLLMISIISSCGTASSTGSNTGSGSTAYTTPSTPTSAPAVVASTPTASSTSSTSSNVAVKTATVTVNGKATTVLTNSQGMTLYYFQPDTASKTACTGGCAQTWPPLLFSGTGNPQADPKLSGELEIYPNANGKQVIYNGHPLYTYGGDSTSGQINGEGIGGKWFVVVPDIAKNAP